MTALVSLLFIAMIPIDCKIFPYTVCLLFCNNYNFGQLINATLIERMTMNIIFAGATPPIN